MVRNETRTWAVAGLLALALCALPGLRAEEGMGGEGGPKPEGEAKPEGDKPKAEGQGFNLATVETIQAKLGDDKLTDEQKTKIEALREQLKAKWEELRGKEEVKAAMDKMKEAAEKKDRDGLKAAREELQKATGGFQLIGEYRKGLGEILTQEQVDKAIPARAPREGKRDGKREGEKSGEGAPAEGGETK